MRELAERCEIDVWCVDEPGAPAGLRTALGSIVQRVRLFERDRAPLTERLRRARAERWFHSSALRGALHRLAAEPNFDLVHLDEPCLASALPRGWSMPWIVHHHKLDLDFARATQAAPWEITKLARLERQLARRTPHHITCSREDAQRLNGRHPHLRPAVVESGVDPREYRPRKQVRDCERLLFTGSLAYEPNLDALEWFLRDIFPRVRHARPGTSLQIVGERPGPRVRRLLRPGVELVGEVDDTRDELARASLSIVPLRIGGGTRLKIPIALASGCPVVSTRIGAEGLGLINGEHLLLADESETFARAVLLLLEKPALAHRLAKRGGEYVCRELSWTRQARAVLRAWQTAARAAVQSSARILV